MKLLLLLSLLFSLGFADFSKEYKKTRDCINLKVQEEKKFNGMQEQYDYFMNIDKTIMKKCSKVIIKEFTEQINGKSKKWLQTELFLKILQEEKSYIIELTNKRMKKEINKL